MNEAAQLKHYEAAAKARDGLAALERAASDQSVVLDDHSNLDVIAVDDRGRTRGGRAVSGPLWTDHRTHACISIDRSMDEDDAEILEGVLPDLYDDAERRAAGRGRGERDESRRRSWRRT